MKVALVYHGVLRWPQGIHTQLNQLKEHDVDIFFCLQKDSQSLDDLKSFNYKKADLYPRPSFNFFESELDMPFLKSIPNTTWLTYSPHYSKGFSLLNYHNFLRINNVFKKDFQNYDLVIVSRSDLKAMFPFDFSTFNDGELFVSAEHRWRGVQMIGNWFYGSPKIMSKALISLFSLIKYDFKILKDWRPKIWNAECYSKLCLDFYKIKCRTFPLNCFASAGDLLGESSGWGSLKINPETGDIYKYLDQYQSCMQNYQKYQKLNES